MNTPRKDQNDRMPPDGATIEEQDWDALDAGDAKPVAIPENGDLRYSENEAVPSGDLPGEDDDNPYQESDEALPDDKEETAISRNMSHEGGRFDEI